MKIKLPRKRKKAFIKEYGASEYHTRRIHRELLMKFNKPSTRYRRFPQFHLDQDGSVRYLFNW